MWRWFIIDMDASPYDGYQATGTAPSEQQARREINERLSSLGNKQRYEGWLNYSPGNEE